VNLTQSTVHVPTNVYDESASVLNGVAFSEALDDVFNSNRKSFSTISWQFYCSFVGFFRIYPGISWGNSDEADQFDCRTRLWYIQAATSSKDVIILVDTSGSMTGLRIEIAKSTVIKILDTFNEDDYFNVISFSDEPDYFEPCYNNSLVQATVRNKQIFTKVLCSLFTSYVVKLYKIFNIYLKNNFNSLGSKCNKVIMLITDGSPSDFREVFEKYNFPDKKVRVFTYLIGREIRDTTQLKWMACNNKGQLMCYFSHISTLADVYEHVQDYIRVLSRPLVIGRYPQKVWTNIYGNERTNELTTTVAMPVYDIKNASYNDGNLLGVIGTDMLLDVLTNVLPKHQLGVQNYPFAITNNGFIIFHPDHRPYHNGKLKPNYNNLDISEVEFIDDGKIRQSMVKGETGKTRLRVKVALDEMVTHE
ncbi:hypothetical protein HELRODRAFT_67485, partial [Helobdella robusta]|uniref:VWFA domain-containing protein n=1 Tax=Helobdella robusta TaxID=6412 RepID=T1FZ15_HELRO